MSRHEHVLDLLRDADPLPPDEATLDQDHAEALLRTVRQRVAPKRRGRRTGWQRGLVYAAATMALVVFVGLATTILISSVFDSDPAVPVTEATTPVTTLPPTTVAETPTTLAPPTTVVVDDAGPVWPPPRYMASVAFDEQSDLLVVFGGTRREEAGLSETWVFDPATQTWTEQDPDVRPPARMSASMAYDRGIDRLVMFGGLADPNYAWDDLWLYDVDADEWEQVEIEGPRPSGRHAAAMTYVDSLGGILLFGGNEGFLYGQEGVVGDTWLLDTATMTWTEIEGPGPSPRDLAGIAYDPVADVVVLAGGFYPGDSLAWIFDPATLTWSPTAEVLGPLSHLDYDPASGLLLSGGSAYSTETGEWSTIPWDEGFRDDGYLGIGPILDAQRGVMYFFHFEIPSARLALEMWEYDLATGDFRLIGPIRD